ncbi:putative rna polymerase 2 transcription elongation factor protein [Zalerion maritima]|uniref:Rna polymerase 2 transcription elongation factor protein n=1 Tax=Zalerion maritima TaxID=339359 RepID=A0AAD5RRZ3_9PEZI|nr:putative rna polymerase 2 transcription elongation factor protein [Zalerion maritima]
MSDAEDDFLGLADGQVLSSDGESDNEDVKETRERSASRASSSRAREQSPNVAKQGTAVKKVKRRKGSGESEDEGEASEAPGSPNSLDSAPMDESDSDVEVPSKPVPSKSPAIYADDDDDEEDKYPVDGLFASEQEKEEIMAMQMLDREQIIADRSQEVERRRQNRLLRQLVSNQESEEKKHKKRKASSADLEDEDDERKPTRVRTKSTTIAGTSGYDDLKRARAAKNDRMRMRAEERQRGRRDDDRRPSSRHSEYSSDGDPYNRGQASKSKTPEPNYSHEPATLRDIEHVRVGRSNFGQICFYPGFEQTMVGCFCRVSIGPDKSGQPTYKMAVVKDIVKGKPYALQYRNTQIVTDQYAVLAHGKAVREWPFLMLSDSKFTDPEFNHYKQTCSADGVSLPKRQYLINKVDELDAIIRRDFTPLELQQKLDRQNALKRRFIPVDKERLRRDLDEAKAMGDENRIAEIQEKLDGADAPRLAFRTSIQVAKHGNNEQQEKLAKLNMRNRRRNMQDVRAAQLREKHRMRDLEEALERGEDVQIDQSRRLKTKAKFVHDVNEKETLLNKPHIKNAKSNGTSAPGTPKIAAKDGRGTHKDSAAAAAMETLRHKQQDEARKKGMPTLSRPITGDDVIGALDLDIDIEI